MPSHGLTLGSSIVETSTFREDTDPAVVRALMNLNSVLIGEGFPAPAETGDNVYQSTYAQNVGGTWTLYAGKPSDPMNPDIITVSASGSATVIWQEEGSTVATYGTVSFVGPTVTVTDGGTKAIVTIAAAPFAFSTIVVAGSSDVVADAVADTLTLTAGYCMDITTTAASDTIDFAWDPTEISGYDAGARQYLRNDAGTIEWVTVGAC
jgi:hypothetical protein